MFYEHKQRMNRFFANSSRFSYCIGSLLAFIHLLFSWGILLDLAQREPDAQWQLIWIFFLPFDFPFSLIVLFGGYLFPDWSFSSLPYPVSDFRGFILPAIVHGMIGPVWYFLLPVAISSFYNTLRQPQKR